VDERRQSAIEASPRIHLVTRRTPGVVELRAVHSVRVLRRGDAAQRGEIARYIAPSVTWSRVSGIARSLDGMHLCRRPNLPTVLGRRRTDLKRANSSGHGRPSCSRTPPQPRAELGDRLLPLPAKRAHFRLARARVDLKQRHFGQALQEPREQQPLLVPRQRIGDGDSGTPDAPLRCESRNACLPNAVLYTSSRPPADRDAAAATALSAI